MKNSYDILIIGGGFYGTYLSEYFAKLGKNVLLCEKENALMKRASYVNQARIHNGYHYPRSVLTALRSRISFPRFCEEFRECIDDSFESYYMIGKVLSKITAKQFESFCERIGAPCERGNYEIKQHTNKKLIEDVYKTVEYTFDAVKLKTIMETRLKKTNVEILYKTTMESVSSDNEKNISVLLKSENEDYFRINTKQVYNCTYSMINSVTSKSKLDIIPLKHEMTEMCLVDVPEILKNKGITVMCGPFFSIMPFPSTNYHTFSHVRYTPHYEWHDEKGKQYFDGHEHLCTIKLHSAWRKMQKDASRYLPILNDCEYISSLWEVKTVLPSSEISDSRPILFKQDYGIKGFHCVMGGKIDNVYDIIEIISAKKLDS